MFQKEHIDTACILQDTAFFNYMIDKINECTRPDPWYRGYLKNYSLGSARLIIFDARKCGLVKDN